MLSQRPSRRRLFRFIAITLFAALMLGAIFSRPQRAQQSPACAPAPSGMVAWYRAENNTNDSQGTNHGTLNGNTGFAAGRVGQAFTFDGDGDLVTVPDTPSLNPTGQITLQAWVYPTADSGGSDVVSVIATKETTSSSQFEIARRNTNACSNGTGIPSGNFAFYLDGITLPNQCSGWVDGGAFLPLNVWSHVALTYNGEEVEAYVNGANTRTIFTGSTLVTGTGLLRIGGRIDGRGFWAGLIDELSLYNRALTGTEISAIYNAGSAGVCPPIGAIGGRVLSSDSTGNGEIGGVTMTLSGSLDATTVTNEHGFYTFTNLPLGGTYTVTPTKTDHSFTPVSQTIAAFRDGEILDFTGGLVNYPISTRVTLADGTSVSGVLITLTGSETLTSTTGANGFAPSFIVRETITPSHRQAPTTSSAPQAAPTLTSRRNNKLISPQRAFTASPGAS